MSKKTRAETQKNDVMQTEQNSNKKKKKSVVRAEEKAASKAAAAPAEKKGTSFLNKANKNHTNILDRTEQGKDIVLVVAYSFLLFASMTIQAGTMSLFLAALAIAACIGKGPLRRMRERFCLPLIAFVLFSLLNTMAAVYSDFGSNAISGLIKVMASLSLAVILIARFDQKHIPALLWGMLAVCAGISLLCVDMGGSEYLLDAFSSITNHFNITYDEGIASSNELRIQGIYNDANITGTILGMAILIGLYLVSIAKERKVHLVGSLLLGICVMGFLTAMSRGAMACFAVSAIVYLFLVAKEDRFRLFLLMLWTAVATAATGAVALTQLSIGSIVPDLMAVACGLVIFVLDQFTSEKLAKRATGHGKAVAGCCAGLAVLALIAAVAALNVTGPYTFENDSFARSIKLSSGSYSLDYESAGSQDTIGVYIYSRNDEQALTATRTDLYNGTLQDASFDIPEDTRVYFEFRGGSDAQLNRVTVLNTSTMSPADTLKLNYRFLPESVASRLQDGLLEGQNVLQRIQFWKDGMSMFAMSPLWGNGLGSVEGLVTAVQPFYYESKYVHNHLIQILDETGILGLVLFLGFVVGAAVLLLQNLKTENRRWVAMLLAGWVMMNTHCFMEISFSIRAYQCLAFAFLMLPIIAFAKPIKESMQKTGGVVLLAGALLFEALSFGLYFGHIQASREWDSYVPTEPFLLLSTLDRLTAMDALDHEHYQLSYVANATMMPTDIYQDKADAYAQELRASGTYSACSGLERYYYLPRGEYEELFACAREGIAQKASDPDSWNFQFDFFREDVLPAIDGDDMNRFITGVLETGDYFVAYNDGRIGPVALTDENAAFLENCKLVRKNELPGDIAKLFLLSGGAKGASDDVA